MSKKDLPHIDAVSGQAAWTLVQGLALRLVKDGVIPKATMKEDVAAMVKYHQKAPSLNPAQRAAAHLFVTLYHMLDTADRSDAN